MLKTFSMEHTIIHCIYYNCGGRSDIGYCRSFSIQNLVYFPTLVQVYFNVMLKINYIMFYLPRIVGDQFLICILYIGLCLFALLIKCWGMKHTSSAPPLLIWGGGLAPPAPPGSYDLITEVD